MAVGFRTSCVRAIEVTERVHSLTEPSIIECECASMMPGMTNLPVASMVRAPAGAVRFFPTEAILPPRMRMSVPSSVPCEAVSTVALRMSVSCAAAPRGCADAAAHAATKKIASEKSLFIFFLQKSLESGVWSLESESRQRRFHDWPS
jgi:hypothetical protein